MRESESAAAQLQRSFASAARGGLHAGRGGAVPKQQGAGCPVGAPWLLSVPLPAAHATAGRCVSSRRRRRRRPAAAMSQELRAGRDEILECQVMWEPDSKKNTQMDRFRAAVGAACGIALGECGTPPPRGRGLRYWGSRQGSEGLSSCGPGHHLCPAFLSGCPLVVRMVSYFHLPSPGGLEEPLDIGAPLQGVGHF